MPVSFAGWSVKAKVKNRRARVAEVTQQTTQAGDVRRPRSLCFVQRTEQSEGSDYRTTRPREKRGAGTINRVIPYAPESPSFAGPFSIMRTSRGPGR